MTAFVALAAWLAASTLAEPAKLTIRVEKLRSDDGRVFVALYDSERGFPGDPKSALRKAEARIVGRAATVELDGLPPGTYAAAVVHDENGNGALDTGWLGIPKEGIGASNGAQRRFGPARFADAAFRLSADTAVSIDVVYVDPF
jgi:uncharacterized protein (DUF2141 family)